MDEEVEIILQQDQVEVTEPLVADYILPTASASTLGGVKIGDNVNIASDGAISIPTASADTKGVIRIGSGLSIDANGIVTADGSSYVLPQATKNTLGGVYVDDSLSTSSANPVQNSAVALALNQTDSNVSTINTTVGGLSTTVGNLSTTVGNLSTTVGNLSSTVSSQTGQISTNTSSISSLSSSVSNLSGDVTTLDSRTTILMTESSEVYAYDDIDDQVWTSGSIGLYAYGMMGYINIDLEGSLTIASGASETIFTLPSLLPEYDVSGVALADDATLKVTITAGGVISVENISSSSVTLSKLVANVPIIIASDNP